MPFLKTQVFVAHWIASAFGFRSKFSILGQPPSPPSHHHYDKYKPKAGTERTLHTGSGQYGGWRYFYRVRYGR